MNYCKKCVQPDTRPGTVFNKEGVCPPCEYAEQWKEIDWSKREETLKDISKFGKENNISGYDCIIGISGGKDSTRQAMYVRDMIGLKPLLVSCTYPPEQQTERGAHNLGNLISLGFDVISVSPGPATWKKLMRRSFLEYGNWARSTEMALYASLPRTAIAYQIPLIFLGENPALTLGGLDSGSLNWNANRMKESNTIAGNQDTLLVDGITNQEIIWYRFPSYEEMQMANLNLVYLGYFWKVWTKIDNAKFSIAHGLEIREQNPQEQGSLHPFEALDDDFVFVNQMIKYLKFGFGKVTDDVCELIRWEGMSREAAFELVKKYDGNCSEAYVKKFCRYIGISIDTFWEIAESYRNKDIWKKNKNNRWELIFDND